MMPSPPVRYLCDRTSVGRSNLPSESGESRIASLAALWAIRSSRHKQVLAAMHRRNVSDTGLQTF
jgi:hypothetical protein